MKETSLLSALLFEWYVTTIKGTKEIKINEKRKQTEVTSVCLCLLTLEKIK